MRRITSSLAVLLSLLLLSTSASVCDLSCSFHQMLPGCQTAKSATDDKQTSISMPSGMDMGSDNSENMTEPDRDKVAASDHPPSMSSRMEMTAEHLEQAAEPQMGTRALPDHSKNLLSCIHGPCRQISASITLSKSDRSQPKCLNWIAISILSALNFDIGFHRIRLQTPSSEMLAPDRLTTTLRI